MHTGFWWKSKKERDQSEDADIGRRIILRWIFEEKDGVVRIGYI
jgi:hypothetical protein